MPGYQRLHSAGRSSEVRKLSAPAARGQSLLQTESPRGRLPTWASPQRVHGWLFIVDAAGLGSLAVIRATVTVVLKHHPARLVVALPAGTVNTCRELGKTANGVICPVFFGLFRSGGPLYADHGDIPLATSGVCYLLNVLGWALSTGTEGKYPAGIVSRFLGRCGLLRMLVRQARACNSHNRQGGRKGTTFIRIKE